MALAYLGSRSPCQEGAHEDFITKNSEMGITVKSLRVKQLDLHDPKLEDLAAIGANDPEYQHIRHLEKGIQENLPMEAACKNSMTSICHDGKNQRILVFSNVLAKYRWPP